MLLPRRVSIYRGSASTAEHLHPVHTHILISALPVWWRGIFTDLREVLCDVTRRLYERGLLSVQSGNASIRGRGDYIWITPAKLPKHALRPDDIVLVFLDGRYVGRLQPSIEYRMHLYVYRRFDWANAIVHAHSPITTLVYELGLKVDVRDLVESAVSVPCIEVVNRYPPGSEELAAAVAEAVSRCQVVVLKGHGVVAVGSDIYSALNAVEALESLCRVTLFKDMIHNM